ncbi:hypothetical protein FSP39_010652 [Pinctada imbricata]|uniref:tRNA (uracil(54)-C(5))-methyltransferase n=1 Tax=Pinctada imbricata TaxID=66713 RepID=A0AA89BJ64_PINIB|nr:hypothetical protein FSP39_010652 [Pinctada imbricata]
MLFSREESSTEETELLMAESGGTVSVSEDVNTGKHEDTPNSSTIDDVKSEETDPYLYTKQDQFTSEIYKVEIQNLPRCGFKELKKRLASIKVNPVKIKASHNKKFAFVTFRNEEEREDALNKIEGHVWKHQTLNVKVGRLKVVWKLQTLNVKKANAVADPLLKKRKLNEEVERDGASSEKKSKVDPESNLPPDIRLKNAVTPLWNMPYEEQLKSKYSTIEGILKNFANQIHKHNYSMRKWLHTQRQNYKGHCCEVLPIKPSPVTTGYRNKCEFTVGLDMDGNDNTVGFRYGQYRTGNSCVGEADHLTNIPESMKRVAKRVQDYCRAGVHQAFNPVKQEGHWKTLTLRTCQGHGILAMLDFHPRNLSKETIEKEKERLKEYFTTGPGAETGITSLHFHLLLDRVNDAKSFDQPFEHIAGDKAIEETLLGMKFKVSPDSFFQVNTLAAEVLYSQIGDWCDVSPTTTVLDICCGTGTIGLTLAKRVSHVIGIDNCEQAIEDARENARLNGVENVTYHCCNVEKIINQILKSLQSRDVVAVVDPPRAGLHQKVIRALRTCPLLTRVVYVSCNPTAAKNNFLDLVRTPSRHNKGEPYRPVRAVPVDMFPQTKHCELVVLFERELPSDLGNSDLDPAGQQAEEDEGNEKTGDDKQDNDNNDDNEDNDNVNSDDNDKHDNNDNNDEEDI